jgi:formylglycine-generating enzyme required for sulfatase activity
LASSPRRCGKRLPLDVEWEVAARGPDGNWGQHLTSLDINIGANGGGSKAVPLWPCTEARDDVNPWGVKNMAGNAREWVLDLWTPGAGAIPHGIPGSARVTRGSCAIDFNRTNAVTQRSLLPSEISTAMTGFRCALTAQ